MPHGGPASPGAKSEGPGWCANVEKVSSSSASTNEHREKAKSLGVIRLAIITVSDTRTFETDVNSQWLRAEIEKLGHEVTAYRLIKDEPAQVADTLDELAGSDARILLWNGGTGISPRDTTFDVLSRKLEKTLPGFGEIFRMLSFEVVGAAAMLSRATAGVYRGKLVISTPGSPNAVQLAWNRLIAPELEHLAWEAVR
ncbi:MAG: molybdenum cofactor biosynthesis protein MoaB [Acidobacteria bacterium]|nr:molybdenum cofactor biosynthesis protein MoaB [Acidobacteriota bacterium]